MGWSFYYQLFVVFRLFWHIAGQGDLQGGKHSCSIKIGLQQSDLTDPEAQIKDYSVRLDLKGADARTYLYSSDQKNRAKLLEGVAG